MLRAYAVDRAVWAFQYGRADCAIEFSRCGSARGACLSEGLEAESKRRNVLAVELPRAARNLFAS